MPGIADELREEARNFWRVPEDHEENVDHLASTSVSTALGWRAADRIEELEAIARQIIEVHEDADHGADIPIYIYKLAKAAMERK